MLRLDFNKKHDLFMAYDVSFYDEKWASTYCELLSPSL